MKYNLLVILSFLVACGSSIKDKNKDIRFFGTKEFIQKEVNEVMETPFFIYKKTSVNNGTTDSINISREEFKALAQPFLSADINDPELKPYYEESLFHDQTTSSITLSYTATNKELEVQNIDVLLNEDGETVKRIFIRRFINKDASSVIEQLSWKPDVSFQVMRLIQQPGKPETTENIEVVWNEK